MKEFGIMVITQEFEEGDLICHWTRWEDWAEYGSEPMFFSATDYDVENYSGKNGKYIKLIQTNPL